MESAIFESIRKDLVSNASARDKLRLQCLFEHISGAWLTAFPPPALTPSEMVDGAATVVISFHTTAMQVFPPAHGDFREPQRKLQLHFLRASPQPSRRSAGLCCTLHRNHHRTRSGRRRERNTSGSPAQRPPFLPSIGSWRHHRPSSRFVRPRGRAFQYRRRREGQAVITMAFAAMLGLTLKHSACLLLAASGLKQCAFCNPFSRASVRACHRPKAKSHVAKLLKNSWWHAWEELANSCWPRSNIFKWTGTKNISKLTRITVSKSNSVFFPNRFPFLLFCYFFCYFFVFLLYFCYICKFVQFDVDIIVFAFVLICRLFLWPFVYLFTICFLVSFVCYKRICFVSVCFYLYLFLSCLCFFLAVL